MSGSFDGRIAGCFDNGRKQFFKLSAISDHGCIFRIVQIICCLKKPKPVVCFHGFFQRNIQLGYKIRPTLRLLGFHDICSNAGSGPQQLLRKNIFLLIIPQVFAKPYDSYSKMKAFFFDGIVHRQK